MLLTERLKSIADQTRAIRESLSDVKGAADANSKEQGRRLISTGSSPSRPVMELARVLSDVREGRRPEWHIQEAMSTSDFPLLFGDLLYRQLLGNYMPWPVTYPAYFKVIDVKDFRVLHLYAIDGGQGLLEQVAEYAPYPETAFVETPYAISVKKYGRRYGLSFELLIQDDMGAFNDRPQMMAVGARRSEEWLATTMMCDINGPHAGFFNAGNGNLASGPLTIKNLQIALSKLKSATDKDGQPIVIDMVHLVTTPGNEIIARNILGANQLRINDGTGGGDAGTFMYTDNWMSGKLALSINPYIKYVASASVTEPWFLIASTSDASVRPAFMFAFLRGRRQPQLWVKDPDAILLGGGDSSPAEGSFDNDSIDYKLRHIFGAAQGDPKAAVASAG